MVKSHVSDYLELAQSIYEDACDRCAVKASCRDLLTLRSRVEDEGLSFLTITLPKFGSDFERCLELGFIDPKCFRSFRKHKRIPAFLRGMLGQVFDQETGRINDYAKTNSPPKHVAVYVDSIRQICHAFKKIKLSCTPKRVHQALENFVVTEQSLEMFSLSGEDYTAFCDVSFYVWSRLVVSLHYDDDDPRHGPRATAEYYTTNQKYKLLRFHERLEPYFPLVGTVFTESIGEFDYHSRELDAITLVKQDDEQPVRVVTVPKTLKAPRIIAIEPACMQFAQQAIRSNLYRSIESYRLTAGHINFSDQSVNQRIAMTSSKDGRYSTIDLSDASDRVPYHLALEMFSSNPELRDCIDACRSKNARLPDGRIVRLNKFASMGSSLCFPIEAMYFYTICVMALLKYRDLPVSYTNVFDVSRDIYIYGDDILVPVGATATVIEHLHKYNCKVNATKTFYSGKFRESCGADCYDGFSVTPIYIRSVPPIDRRSTSELVSYNDSANLFYEKGYYRTSHRLFKFVEDILGALPSVKPNSGVLGRNHLTEHYCPRKRYNRRTQQMEMVVYRPQSVYRNDPLDGYAALSKSLRRLHQQHQSDDPRDPLHLERSERFHAVTLKREGVPITLIGLTITD